MTREPYCDVCGLRFGHAVHDPNDDRGYRDAHDYQGPDPDPPECPHGRYRGDWCDGCGTEVPFAIIEESLPPEELPR